MKWFSNLLRKPAAKSAAKPLQQAVPPPLARASKPPLNVEALRTSLNGAVGESEVHLASAALGRALADVGQAPRSEDSPGVWAAAIKHVGDRQLALQWLSELSGDEWLSDVAIHARIAEIRLGAAHRIADSAALKGLAAETREKDKSVHRYCSETLRQRQRAAEAERRAAEFEQALEQVLAESPLPLMRLLALEKNYSDVKESTSDPAYGRCDALFLQARKRQQREISDRRDFQLRQTEAIELRAACVEAETTDRETYELWRKQVAALALALNSLPDWLEKAECMAVLRDVEHRIGFLGQELDSRSACEEFLSAAEALGESKEIEDRDAAWSALPKPQNSGIRQELEARWQRLRFATVAASAPKLAVDLTVETRKAEMRELDSATLKGLLDQLDKSLEDGLLNSAESLEKRIGEITSGLRIPPPLDQRIAHAGAVLGELRAWARWSTLQARDRLVADAEALAGSGHPAEQVALEVASLRDEWKRLNSHGPSTKTQWAAFDAALEKAYEPVTAHRAEEAVRQAEARAVREALCSEWEDWLSKVTWAVAEYPAIEARRQEFISQWQAAPRLSFRDERQLRKRFDGLIAVIDTHLEAVRTEETARREEIIAAAERLLELTDSTRAANEIKALQLRWRDQAGPLRLRRSEEQKLWQRFRAACDSVFSKREAEFARRDAVRAEQVSLREAQRQARQNRLDAFAALLSDGDSTEIKAALMEFRHDWSGLRVADRSSADGLDRRAFELQQQAQQKIDEQRRQKIRSRYNALMHKTEVVSLLESALLSADEHGAEKARNEFASLPRLSGAVEARIRQRFTSAGQVTVADLQKGQVSRDEMLLDLEIMLGLPSPEALADQRRIRQIGRLKDRFGRNNPDEAEQLLVEWHATAAKSQATDTLRISAVIDKLVELSFSAKV